LKSWSWLGKWMMIGILHEHACLHLEIEWLRRGSDIVVHLLRPWNHNIEQVKWLDQIFFVLIFNFLIIFRSPPPVLLWGPLLMPFWFFFHWKVPQHLFHINHSRMHAIFKADKTPLIVLIVFSTLLWGPSTVMIWIT